MNKVKKAPHGNKFCSLRIDAKYWFEAQLKGLMSLQYREAGIALEGAK